MQVVSCKTDADWLAAVQTGLRMDGCAVVTDILDADFLEATQDATYRVQTHLHDDIGLERLDRAEERGVLRLMFRYDPHFFRFLAIPEILAIVDAVLSPTAVLHLQNGFILPASAPDETPAVFQYRYHPDFPRVLNGYVLSINTLITISPFTPENGGTS